MSITQTHYGNGTLPAQIRSRIIDDINGLSMHVLETGFETAGRPCVLLLHGFPEIAYSWRKIMLPLARAGYHVLAPDRRGFGRTTGWDPAYTADLTPFNILNRLEDTRALLSAFGYQEASAVIGHDFGATLAGWCALVQPSVFRSVVLMSSPFEGPPAASTPPSIEAALASLPRPRKLYTRYYATAEAGANMQFAAVGVTGFMRGYFHYKSADWKGNVPHPLERGNAEELGTLPTYYIMDLDRGMAETVAAEAPTGEEAAACRWLTDAEVDVYATEYARTGFQGGLNEYRCDFDALQIEELASFAGRTIDVPALFIGGRSDWGVHQTYGALDHMMQRYVRTCAAFILSMAPDIGFSRNSRNG